LARETTSNFFHTGQKDKNGIDKFILLFWEVDKEPHCQNLLANQAVGLMVHSDIIGLIPCLREQ
jgi:hypothetical protein